MISSSSLPFFLCNYAGGQQGCTALLFRNKLTHCGYGFGSEASNGGMQDYRDQIIRVSGASVNWYIY